MGGARAPRGLARSLLAAVAVLLACSSAVAAVRSTPPAARTLAVAAPRPAAAAGSVGQQPVPRVPVAADVAPRPVAPQPAGTPIPVAAGAGPAPVLAPVDPVRVAVVVTTTEEEEPAARAAVGALEGVVRVAAITVVATTLGGVPADLAAVEVEEFRAFTPEGTATSAPLWERVLAGDVAVTHEFGTVHQVPLGSTLASGVRRPTGDPVTFRVGAFATNGTPPVADAVVAASALPAAAQGERRLLVALDPLASPTAAVEALVGAGLQAVEVPDPRAPRSEPVIPAGGITPENVWDHLALCESSGNWQINTGNGYYGGLQFLPESWALVGGAGLPHEWPREEQIYRATLLWQLQGWEAWPQCARKLGLIVDPPPAPTPTPTPTGPGQPVSTEPAP